MIPKTLLYDFVYSPNLTWRDVQHLVAYSSNYDVPRSDDWVQNAAGLWGESTVACLICGEGGGVHSDFVGCCVKPTEIVNSK